MTHKGYALLGDQTYGGRFKVPAGASEEFLDTLRAFKRQALHARRLGFDHPDTGEFMQWEVALPDDMQDLLQAIHENDQQQ